MLVSSRGLSCGYEIPIVLRGEARNGERLRSWFLTALYLICSKTGERKGVPSLSGLKIEVNDAH